MPKSLQPLARWDDTRKRAYRDAHPEEVFLFHVLLDGSGSMYVHESQLRTACNMYMQWLQRHAPPMSLVDLRCFGSMLQTSHVQSLSTLRPLTAETYSSTWGGTAMRDAVGAVGTQTPDPGQHILILFTDGVDEDSVHWSEGQVHTLLSTLQDASGWLAVFLGAFPEALHVAKALGFREGNCLVFGSERIPEAFERLRRATESYLLASPQQRKLLAQGGVFQG